MVLITNNNLEAVDPSNYDKVIYLGFTPSRLLEENEIVVDQSNLITVYNYVITLKGLCNNERSAITKKDLEYNYKKGINQIVLGESVKQCSHITEGGEEIIFVPLKGHKELTLNN